MSCGSSVPAESGTEEQLAKQVESMKIDVPADSDMVVMDTSSSQPSAASENCENGTTDTVFFGKAPSEGRACQEILRNSQEGTIWVLICQ